MALEFDLNKTFDENTAEFRKHLEGLDPECAKIFFDNEAILLDDRIGFNDAVLERLKTLPPKTEAT